MTAENRRLITPDEIVGFEFECKNSRCMAKVTLPSDSGGKPLYQCPVCKTRWIELGDAKVGNALESLMQSPADVVRLKENIGFTLRIELKATE